MRSERQRSAATTSLRVCYLPSRVVATSKPYREAFLNPFYSPVLNLPMDSSLVRRLKAWNPRPAASNNFPKYAAILIYNTHY